MSGHLKKYKNFIQGYGSRAFVLDKQTLLYAKTIEDAGLIQSQSEVNTKKNKSQSMKKATSAKNI